MYFTSHLTDQLRIKDLLSELSIELLELIAEWLFNAWAKATTLERVSKRMCGASRTVRGQLRARAGRRSRDRPNSSGRRGRRGVGGFVEAVHQEACREEGKEAGAFGQRGKGD